MSYLITVMPGLSLACVTFLLLIGIRQALIYRQSGYQRSLFISLFCVFAAVFAGEPLVIQSRSFPVNCTHYYVMVSATCLCLSSIFYVWSLNFFLAIPNWLLNTVTGVSGVLALGALASIFSFAIWGESFFFDVKSFQDTENYFVDSYSHYIGQPRVLGSMILAGSSLINSLSAIWILGIVLRSSRDIYFIIGLLLTVLASTVENFLLPFTLEIFVPLIFISNLFEAFRMTTLASQEYLLEKWQKQEATTVGLTAAVKTEPETDAEKYQNSSLTKARLDELGKKVIRLFEQDKIYLNPNLNSDQLAKVLGIPSYQISQVVNIGLQTTFFDLVSTYRVDEMKRRLGDPSLADSTIINLAYEVGFNSKSSFNTAFKKATGLTPSEYRKQALGGSHLSQSPATTQ